MDKIEKIGIMKDGTKKELTLMVSSLTDRSAKTGKPYVAAELSDGTKTIKVNFFDENTNSLSDKGMVKGAIIRVNLSKKDGFFNQEGWCLNNDPTITVRDFVKAAPIDPDKNYGWLLEQVKNVDTYTGVGPYKSIAQLTLKLLKENEEDFKKSSAAVEMHHNFLSGLLYHTVRMVAMAIKLCEVYTSLDRELLVCATALHDIGKVNCYETSDVGDASVTIRGRLLDHSVSGIMMINEAVGTDLYNSEKIEMLEHMIASHHGKLEWGAVVTPAFPEAEALHLIDMMDSHINMFELAYDGQEQGTVSDTKVFGLENSYIYKPICNDKW